MDLGLADRAYAFDKKHGITATVNELHAISGERPNVIRMNTRLAFDEFGCAPLEMFGLIVVLDPRIEYGNIYIAWEDPGDDEGGDDDHENFRLN